MAHMISDNRDHNVAAANGSFNPELRDGNLNRDRHKTYLTPDADELLDAEVFIQKRPKKDIVSDMILSNASDRAYEISGIGRVKTIGDLAKEVLVYKLGDKRFGKTPHRAEKIAHSHLRQDMDTKAPTMRDEWNTKNSSVSVPVPNENQPPVTEDHASDVTLCETEEIRPYSELEEDELMELVEPLKSISTDPASQELIKRWSEQNQSGREMATLLGRSKAAVNKWRARKK